MQTVPPVVFSVHGLLPCFSCVGTNRSANTLSIDLASTSSPLNMLITNVYAPSSPNDRLDFLVELKSISPPPSTPWMLCGDFNMIRYAHEKNNANFRMAEAKAFNDCINDLCLLEILLLDRNFTWSNKRSSPTLERLDRVFINLCWDELLPGTVLCSLTRTTSTTFP